MHMCASGCGGEPHSATGQIRAFAHGGCGGPAVRAGRAKAARWRGNGRCPQPGQGRAGCARKWATRAMAGAIETGPQEGHLHVGGIQHAECRQEAGLALNSGVTAESAITRHCPEVPCILRLAMMHGDMYWLISAHISSNSMSYSSRSIPPPGLLALVTISRLTSSMTSWLKPLSCSDKVLIADE